MNPEMVREWAIGFPQVEECFPFGDDTLVFKVYGKIFLLLSLNESPGSFNAKCDPEKAILWREEFPDAVFPGYHMNKKHWNTVKLNGTLSAKIIREMIEDSYKLVAKKKKTGNKP